MNEIEFLASDGTWRLSKCHANNIKKSYELWRITQYHDYYVNRNQMYRIRTREPKCSLNTGSKS